MSVKMSVINTWAARVRWAPRPLWTPLCSASAPPATVIIIFRNADCNYNALDEAGHDEDDQDIDDQHHPDDDHQHHRDDDAQPDIRIRWSKTGTEQRPFV